MTDISLLESTSDERDTRLQLSGPWRPSAWPPTIAGDGDGDGDGDGNIHNRSINLAERLDWKGACVRRYFSFSHLNLPKTTGVDDVDGRRTSVDHAGHLSFGPYITLDKGSYYAGFDLTFDSIDGQASIDVKVEDKTIAAEALDDVIVGSLGLYGIAFSIEHETRDVEVRLEVTTGVKLTLHRLVIFSI